MPYEGPMSAALLKDMTDMELIVLVNELKKYPEDRNHYNQVMEEIRKRSARLGGGGANRGQA